MLVSSAGTDIGKILEMLPIEEIRHMRRVGILVDLFVQGLHNQGSLKQFSEEYKFFGKAAVYHDIGKAWISKSILTKPGELTEEETIVMHSHPVVAQRLFEQIKLGSVSGMPAHLIPLAMDSAMYHHEWWNGKGYPYGKQSDSIPLIARITSVCDAYDAMTSDRVYRKAYTPDLACRELEKNAGTQFDPQLIQSFLECEPDLLVLSGKIHSRR